MKKQMNPDSPDNHREDPGCGCGSGCCTGAMVD